MGHSGHCLGVTQYIDSRPGWLPDADLVIDSNDNGHDFKVNTYKYTAQQRGADLIIRPESGLSWVYEWDTRQRIRPSQPEIGTYKYQQFAV